MPYHEEAAFPPPSSPLLVRHGASQTQHPGPSTPTIQQASGQAARQQTLPPPQPSALA